MYLFNMEEWMEHELQLNITNMEHSKSATSPIPSCPVVQWVRILSVLLCIRAQENSFSPHPRPLSTAVLIRTNSLSLSARTAGGHSHEEIKDRVAGVLPKNPIVLTSLAEPMPKPVTLKGQKKADMSHVATCEGGSS